MKKHLIAAGVVAAFAAPAMAQNVQVYGILDVNYSTADSSATGTASSDTGMGSNALFTSRLGFRGSEDLGGGLKAEFQLEGKLTPETGTLGSANANQIFDRESWIGLSGNFGAIRMGRSDVTSAQGIDTKVSQGADLGNVSGEIGVDQNRVVRYTSPKFAGFQAEVGYSSPTSTATTNGEISSGANNTGNTQGLYVSYEQGPLGVYVGRQSLKISNTYDQNQTTLGAKYDFGVVSVGALYQKSDAATQAASTTGGDYKNTVLSAAVPLSNGYKLHALYETSEKDTKDNADFKQYIVAVTKSLSKRTSVYGAYTMLNRETTGIDVDTATVGIIHNF